MTFYDIAQISADCLPIIFQNLSDFDRLYADLRYYIHLRRLEIAEQHDRSSKTFLKSTQECLLFSV